MWKYFGALKNTFKSTFSNKEEKKLMTMELRPYQLRVVNDIGERNTIVKMPTGSGERNYPFYRIIS